MANGNGFSNLVRFRNDSAVVLTSGSNNTDPNSAASRLVFASTRDGLPQVYIADLDVTTVHRVTNSPSFDRSAALSPHGDSIVFVSNRSGTPRLWLINSPALNAGSFDTPAALATGSENWVPEDGPAWSPNGHTIAFTSTRSGASEVYVIPSGGGTATEITTDPGGAFYPTWSPDGATIYYVAANPALELRQVSAIGGDATTVVADPLGVGGPASCGAAFCLFSTDPERSGGSVSAYSPSKQGEQVIFTRTAALERQPAILLP